MEELPLYQPQLLDEYQTHIRNLMTRLITAKYLRDNKLIIEIIDLPAPAMAAAERDNMSVATGDWYA